MNKLKLYESFIEDYDKLTSEYLDYKNKYERDKTNLWDKYKSAMIDIFHEMDGYDISFREYPSGNITSNIGEILDKLSTICFVTGFSKDEINERLRSAKFLYEVKNKHWVNNEKSENDIHISKINEFIFHTLECINKFKILKDDFELSGNFVISTVGHEHI